ncbi:MAG: DUF3341 domain-containing protein [Chthoniobacterales bacterium]
MNNEGLYGIMAEFVEPEQLLAAAKAAYGAGYRKMDAYSPYAIEGVADAIGFRKTRMPLIVLLGGICGAITAYFMQWYSATISYPLNVGGRPLHSWPAFIPIAFELTILFAALAGVIGMFAANGLPQPYHPVFNAPEFKLASQTRFFLCIEADDHVFRAEEVREFFLSLGPEKILEVEK